jgi:hypothetical protein
MWIEPCLSATGDILASKVVSSAKNWHSKFDPEPSTKVTLCRAVPRIRILDKFSR